jgi:chaperonin GroES
MEEEITTELGNDKASPEREVKSSSIKKLLKFFDEDVHNIAKFLSEEELLELGEDVVNEFEMDLNSRKAWADSTAESMMLAKQVREAKSDPFPDCSNIKYPLITLATIQFAANTYPLLINNGRVVETNVIGKDPDGKLAERAERVGKYMDYQLLTENTGWEEGMDRLLHSWPIVGTSFKKMYYDTFLRKICIDIIPPEDIIVNNTIKSLESARRITHRFYLHTNDIIERMRGEVFTEIEDVENLTPAFETTSSLLTDATGKPLVQQSQDKDAAHEFLEMHRYMDLDKDGYQEPYIVTLHRHSRKVFRIVPRYRVKDIELTASGKIKRIKARQYFIDYHFIPSPDCSFYSVGFGTLLTPINRSINSLTNQLIDSGTYANTQTGIVGRSLKLNSDFKITMGRFQVADVSSNIDINKQVMLMPFKEPSSVLYQLLGLMIDTGEKLANISQIITGTQQVQNVPATTMLETLRQGLKVFSSIQKRLYRSEAKEFNLLYELNSEYGNAENYITVLNEEAAVLREDFNEEGVNVRPIADPTISTAAEKMARLNAIPQIAQAFPGEFNRSEGLKEYLTGLEFKQPERFIVQPDPNAPPSASDQKDLAVAAAKLAEPRLKAAKIANDQDGLKLKGQLIGIKAIESSAKIEKMQAEAAKDLHEVGLSSNRAERDTEMESHKKMMDQHKVNMDLRAIQEQQLPGPPAPPEAEGEI